MVKNGRLIPVTMKQRGRKIAVRYWSINLDAMGRLARLIVVVCAALAAQIVSVNAAAAVPVVESPGSAPNRAPNTTTSPPPSTSTSGARSYGVDQNQAGVASTASDTPQKGKPGQSATSETFLRLQQLEADVADLRGIIEEQS